MYGVSSGAASDHVGCKCKADAAHSLLNASDSPLDLACGVIR